MAYPASLTGVHAAGRLKDGDELYTLKVPEMDGKFRYEKIFFRVMPSGQPVFVMAVAPQNSGGTGPGTFGNMEIRQNEYWANYIGWANFDAAPFAKKLTESNIFAKESQLTGMYTPGSQFPTAATNQLTDYVIDGDGVITKDPKPASGTDVKEAQDKQNQLLTQLANNLTGGTSTTGTSTATGTQKIVRILLFAGAAVLAVVVGLKVFGKKKK